MNPDICCEECLKENALETVDGPSLAKEQVVSFIQERYIKDGELYFEFKNDPDASIKLQGHIDYFKDVYNHITTDDVYVVWFCYTLGNWKALCSTTIPDGKYYEVTYDAKNHVCYTDEYVKKHQLIQVID